MNAICKVEGCYHEVHQNEMCAKHYGRWYRHGTVEFARPDWGNRSKHPRYGAWSRLRDSKLLNEDWQDFWKYVADTGLPASARHKLRRKDISKLFGPDNFYWYEQTIIRQANESDTEFRNRQYKDRRTKSPDGFRNYHYQTRFGIAVTEYDAMRDQQRGLCAICTQPETIKDRSLAVDHDHITGKVRGLLCGACNKGLGLFGDSTKTIQAAIEYLNAHKDA